VTFIDRRAPFDLIGSLMTWTSGKEDLVDVEEAVALQADVDEGRFHAGQHVVDLAEVDVADERASAAAFDVDLGDFAR